MGSEGCPGGSIHETLQACGNELGAAEHNIRTTGRQGPGLERATRECRISNDHNPHTEESGRGWVVELAGERVEIEQSLAGVTMQTVAAIEDHGAISGLLKCRQLLRHPVERWRTTRTSAPMAT